MARFVVRRYLRRRAAQFPNKPRRDRSRNEWKRGAERLRHEGSFPIPGAPQAFPADGQQLALHGLEWPANWLAGPALFYSQPSQNSFVIIAQDGHQDGGSAAVTFHFYIGSDGYLRLNVTAVGVHAVVWDWINQRVAYGFWDQFRQQLAVNLVKNGEGTYAPIR
jgi:hypothetical protein